MATTQHHFIDGSWTAGSGSDSFKSLNPSEGSIVWEGNEATPDDVDQAVQAASAASADWASTHFESRLNLLQRFQGFLERDRDRFAELISQETGKPLWETRGEVAAAIGKISISYRAFMERTQMVEEKHPSGWSMTRFRPHGVVAVYGPFNFPLHLPNGHIVPALLAGNTIVLKPSELTPLVAQEMVKLWEEVGLPKGVLNLVQGGRGTGEALSKHPGLNGVFFTGSAKTGLLLNEQFARQPEKILALELGGNNPLIVDQIDDPEAAAYTIIQSAFASTGQRCTCARRLIVTEGSEGDAVIAALTEMSQGVLVGDYRDDPQPFCGPLIAPQAVKQALETQDQLRNAGGKVLLEMQALPRGENFVSPGIMDVTAIAEREDEELFAPFLQVIRVPDLDRAIAEANKTRYGLAAGILTKDRERYMQFFRRARAGIVNWNTPLTGASSSAPFGGVGISGNHRPSAFFAADYCSYPVASIESSRLKRPAKPSPGIRLEAASA